MKKFAVGALLLGALLGAQIASAAHEIGGNTGYMRRDNLYATEVCLQTQGANKAACADANMAQCIDLNTATIEQLDALQGVGKTIAARIIAGRPYTSTTGLQTVKGIGKGKLYQRLQTETCVK